MNGTIGGAMSEAMTDAIGRLPAFSFLWPRMLWLAVLVVLLAIGYVWLDARRRRGAVSHPALRAAGIPGIAASSWRRHVPAVLILLALAALVIAIARPQAVLTLPSRIETVIVVVDLSGSMRAQDVTPSRIRAAQQAAKGLLDAKPSGVSMGVVAMAGTAALAQAPSRRKEDVAAAIDRLKPQGGTALGNGLLIALTTLLPKTGNDVARLLNEEEAPPTPRPGGARPPGAGAIGAADAEEAAPTPGSYSAGAIVLFSDGESNAGPGAMQAAQLAATHGVRIYTVGVGTIPGVVLTVDGWSSRVRLDEQVLQQVANATGAEYFRLENATQLKTLYRALNARLTLEKRDQVEVTALFAALGALLAAMAALLSLWWSGRVL